ncbi:hypothetical protein V7O66_04710 [Methanolobus sp. ZRKC3]|uniref:hypothetical protein n=1 Tax=Methanolobus sp. ZRKC3 TaxID=3125786 RepID=UPI00324D5121
MNNTNKFGLILITLIISIVCFSGLACADENLDNPYDIKKLDKDAGKQPAIVYPVFGYANHNYTFNVTYNYTVANEVPDLENIKVVFYWDTWRNTDPGNRTELSYTNVNLSDNVWQWKTEASHPGNRTELSNTTVKDLGDNVWQWEAGATHSWPRKGTYGIQIGVFEDEELIDLSYWMPIDIRKDIEPNKPHELYMRDPKGTTENATLYKNRFKDWLKINTSNPKYYGYEKEFYTFTTNATDDETNVSLWYNFSWGDGSSDVTRRDKAGTPADYSHSWSFRDNKTPYNIETKAIKRDLYDPKKDVESEWNSSAYIIIKKDPEWIENLGIIISILGLSFIALTGIKETVTIEVSIFGHEYRRRSIQYAIGVLLILIGLYMVFVMGRCPWDMPWPFEWLFYDKIK